MPVRSKSGPGQCSKCDRLYTDLLEHITKRHQHDRFEQEEVEEYGLVACICGRVVRNRNGLAKHHSRYGCLSLPNTAQRITNQQPIATSTLTSLSASSSHPNVTAQPPSISMSSTLTPLSSSAISRSTIRPVNLDNNPLMPSSIRHAPSIAPPSAILLVEDEEEEEEEQLEEEHAVEEEDEDMDEGEDMWSEEEFEQDVGNMEDSGQSPVIQGGLVMCSPSVSQQVM